MIVTATALNVRSGPNTSFRVLNQLKRGELVTVMETVGDWAWTIPGFGWVNRSFLSIPPAAEAPNGLLAIRNRFGEPGDARCSSGRVHLPAPLKLGWMNASVSIVACHIELEETFTRVFREIFNAGLWGEIRTFDGIYNNRPTKMGTKKSTHAWGISVDLNADTNRMGRTGDMDRRIVSIFESHGFTWLGPMYDPMHFQYASGY